MIQRFIEVTKENMDTVFGNLNKLKEMEYLEMQNDEYNYGHNIPSSVYDEDFD